MKTASQLAILVLAAFNLSAATLLVSLESTNPVPPDATWETAAKVIQDAVDAAKAGDTVLVTNGVYSAGGRTNGVLHDEGQIDWYEDYGWSRVVVTNSIRLESVNGPSVATIDGGWDGEPWSETGVRCVYLGTNAVLSGFALTNGWAYGTSGGGVFSEPSGVVTNCLLSGNYAVARDGGGAFGGTLYNCTLTGNVGGGVSGGDGGFHSCTVFNSIGYYNSGGNYAEGTTLNFCCTTPLPTNGVGNITGPPLFMDMAAGDFRLREDSPCIDAGTNLVGFTMMATNVDTGETYVAASYTHDPTDMLGNTRFIDGNFDGKVAWDIGAYEFNSFRPPRFNVQPQLTSDGWKLNINGAANQWVHLQRSSDLKNWEDVYTGNDWSFFMGAEGVRQVTDLEAGTGQKAMFYRVVVP